MNIPLGKPAPDKSLDDLYAERVALVARKVELAGLRATAGEADVEFEDAIAACTA
jgi:hypothetical protein